MALLLVFSLGNQRVNTLLEIGQSLGNSGIKHYHCTRTVGFTAYGAELKTVTCKGERRCSVAVSVVNEQLRYLRYVEFHAFLTGHSEQIFLVSKFNMVEQISELLAQERRMIAGGASFAPSLWSLVALITLALSSPLWR